MNHRQIDAFVSRLVDRGVVTDPQRLHDEMVREFGERVQDPGMDTQPPWSDRPDLYRGDIGRIDRSNWRTPTFPTGLERLANLSGQTNNPPVSGGGQTSGAIGIELINRM